MFETVRSQAGIAIVEEWKQSGEDYYLYHLVYVKNGRQFHKRVYVSGGAINSIELSYARAWEREKAPVARRILRGFRHGDLLKLHSICQPTNCLASLSKLDKAVIQLDGGCIGLYPTRPRSPPPPSLGQDLEESQFSDCESQVPTDWDDWEAA